MPYREHLSKETVKEIDHHAEDGLWNPEYVTYDEKGIKEIGCMRCGTPVIARSVKEEKCPHCHNLVQIEGPAMPLANYARCKKDTGTGTYVELMVCADCLPLVVQMAQEEMPRVFAQIEAGHARELTKAGRKPDQIKATLERIRQPFKKQEEVKKHA